MYTAVLMVTLAASAQTAEFGARRGNSGCCGYANSYGGGCYAGYSGCGGYSGYGYYGSGSYGCSGSYRTSNYGYPMYGAGYASTPYSTYGNYVSPNVIVQSPSNTVRQSNYLSPNSANGVSIRVLLPNSTAQVWFDDNPTTQTGMDRLFVSSAPTSGSKYVYTVKARWTENGQTINRERRVEFQPGQTLTIDFRSNPPAENLAAPKAR